MPAANSRNSSLVVSYLVLRRAIGVLGIALPFVLGFGKVILQGAGIQSSISGYYYTAMRDEFVGVMCAVAIFLLSYKGYDRQDSRVANFAGGCAIGIALFPTTPDAGFPPQAKWIGVLHLAFAAAYFLALAYFSLFLFTKSDGSMTAKKRQRNLVYRICGGIMLACLALIAIAAVPPIDAVVGPFDPRFWLESIAVIAFGVSWLTKGEMVLKDGS